MSRIRRTTEDLAVLKTLKEQYKALQVARKQIKTDLKANRTAFKTLKAKYISTEPIVIG
jgi:hypothetical protein